MATHRFTVNVPNPSSRRAVVDLRLEAVRRADLAGLGLDLDGRTLETVSAGITLDPCGEETQRRLEIGLAARESRDVHVVIETAAASAGGIAAFHLVDRRAGKRAGGVTLACVEPALVDPPGQTIPTPRPCPIVLAGNPYPVRPGSDPSRPVSGRRIALGSHVELVVPITNPGKHAVEDVEVYLEHLGSSDAEFAPATWRVGRMAAGAVFYASWLVHPSGVATGIFEASIVVASRGRDPVRLLGRIEFKGKEGSRVSARR
jgi:hypothetical protein